MTRLRLLTRIVMLATWTCTLFAIRLAFKPLRVLSPEIELGLRGWIVMFWSRGALQIINANLTVSGVPPKRPFFLVCNHQTLLDMVILWAVTDTAYVSKDEVKDWPLIGTMARGMNTIFIDRENIRDTARVNTLIKDALEQRLGITVFAEGGCGDGSCVFPFKPPLLQPAAVLNMPVHYATINYSTPPGCPPPGEVMVWRVGVSFPQYCIDVLKLPGFSATIDFGPGPMTGADRKQLARELHLAVRSKYIAVNEPTGHIPAP